MSRPLTDQQLIEVWKSHFLKADRPSVGERWRRRDTGDEFTVALLSLRPEDLTGLVAYRNDAGVTMTRTLPEFIRMFYKVKK